ncbi:hypothetical protein AVEN_132432-1 [Araneus ventricosus]|uniref:RNA-directed DNA polymerase from transposon X-element n=1 Tax=Araneus ventricosus TaxID=182803 RepID=A0A4Y2II45_ARAVE|nr:hypothetical protein AVEN_132432-1 [Araneus ventricosus]
MYWINNSNEMTFPIHLLIILFQENYKNSSKNALRTISIPVPSSEIADYIDKLGKGKSSGFTNLMIKRMPIKSVIRLTEIINGILKLQYFPNQWKSAIEAPILKPGKKPQGPKQLPAH